MSDHQVNDDIVTYNPKYSNEHYDSSEFGDHGDDAPNEKFLIRPKVFKKFVTEKDVLNKVSRVSNCHNVTQNFTPSVTGLGILCHHCSRLLNCPKSHNLDQDGCRQGTSKVNQTKKLSNIFHRSNNRKATAAEENDRSAINNKRMYCPECQQRQIRKLHRKQRHRAVNMDSVMPTHVLPPQIRTNLGEPTIPLGYQPHFSNASMVYAGEVKVQKRKVYKYTRDCGLEKKKQRTRLTNRSQQYSGYAVYNSQCCQRYKDGANSACCNMPPVPSFWEFMFNRLSAKYQEAMALAACEDCRPVNCSMVRHPNSKATPSQETSETQTDRIYSQPKLGVDTSKKNSECQTQTNEVKPSRRTSIFNIFSPRPSETASPTTSKKMNTPLPSKNSDPMNPKCKCPSEKSPVTKLAFPDNNKSCQLSHDGLTQALKDKYNGEVLCIHNPPCILINGCVNLPHQAPKPLDIWQITTARRKADPKKNHRLEVCQLPSIELQRKDEKSDEDKPICIHRSPCEVVPVCYDSNCSPDYVGSCEDNPVCKKLPVCLIETEQKTTGFSCQHVPLCADVPGSFEVSELGGSVILDQESMASDGSTQVKQPLHLICHHKPHCLMIPRCIGQIMVIRRKGGAIPDCIHQPPCEYIPACGRNYVKMLAACSCSLSPRPQCRIT